MSFAEDDCPEDKIQSIFKLTNEEITIIKKFIDISDIVRASQSGLQASNFKGASEAKNIIDRYNLLFSESQDTSTEQKHDTTNIIKLLLILPELLPFISRSTSAYKVFEQLNITSSCQRAVDVFCFTLFVKHDLLRVQSEAADEQAKEFVSTYILKFI